MINHVSIGVRDLARARRFYDAVLDPPGYRCVSEGATSLGYGGAGAAFWVEQTDHPVPADARSKLHFCFDAPDREAVDAFHRAAPSAGGTDNGPPGLRPDYGPDYYAAFAVDPDGYRLEAYCSRRTPRS
jgi:catechol 2,3-dioxygenase-like lactoylglutathione lyase family enzyme